VRHGTRQAEASCRDDVEHNVGAVANGCAAV
jgi:hypothetical protein